MASGGIRNKSSGLVLAHHHRSAVGQAKAEAVYKHLRRAQETTDATPPEVRREISARAIRSALDRVRRLGERVREDKRVAPRDRHLMLKEFEHLKRRIVTLLTQGKGSAPLVDAAAQLDLSANRSQAFRLVDAVFRGEVTVKDSIDKRGELLDLRADTKVISLGGVFELKDEVTRDVRTAIDSLSDVTGNRKSRRPLSFDGQSSGPGWVENAIDKVRGDILIHASSAPHMALGDSDRLRDAALLLHDL